MAPTRSEVWKYFSKKDLTSVKCRLCDKVLKCANNTTNMTQHLKHKHTKEWDNIQNKCTMSEEVISSPSKKKSERDSSSEVIKTTEIEIPTTSKIATGHLSQPAITTTFTNMQSFSSGGHKYNKTTQSIVEMILADNLPFRFVEGAGFKKFMKVHFPLYKVPTRNTIKNHMEKMYIGEIKKFKEKLSTIANVCLTTDIWTDTEMKSMIGVTVHGIYENKQFSGIIGVFSLTEAHTARHISEVLQDVLNDFSINKKSIMAVVTDNGANIVKAVCDSFGKNHHIPCFAHTLNLVIQIINNDKESNHDSYYMFQDDSDSAPNKNNNNKTNFHVEALKYLSDSETSLTILNKYQNIKHIFLKYNTILPSSAPVERLFSYGGMVLRPHRRNMNDKLFEQLVVLKSSI